MAEILKEDAADKCAANAASVCSQKPYRQHRSWGDLCLTVYGWEHVAA